MSCPNCKIHRGPFKTEADFAAFRKVLAEKVRNSELEELGEMPSGPFFQALYRCGNCSSKWLLQFPDQSFRGGWNEK